MKILYITDVSQLQDYFSNQNFYKSLTPFTGDISVAYELIKKNIHFLNEWDFLTNDDIQNNFDLANDFSKNWWEELFSLSANPNNINFSATQQDMVYSLEAAFNAKSIYMQLLKKYKIEEIHGFFLKEQAVIRTGPFPTNRAVRSVAQSILFWICKKHSIPLYHLTSQYPLSVGSLK